MAPAPDDIYVVAACRQGVTVSTCGTSSFESVVEVRSGSLDDSAVQSCSADYDQCQSDGLGAATSGYTYTGGLMFIVIDGVDENAAGPYQMSVIF